MKKPVLLVAVALLTVACGASVRPSQVSITPPYTSSDRGSFAQSQPGRAQHPRADAPALTLARYEEDARQRALRSSLERSQGTKREARGTVPESSKATPRTVFSRRLDRKKLEARGAVSSPELSAEVLLEASTFNNATWDAEQRQELLTYLRDRPAEPTATFDEGDARIIATIQSGSGAEADGKLCDETMAVLLAAGFRFSAREENPLKVELHFYPGELEDRGAWDEATNGKDYYTIAAPEGEGVLYVRAGGRIVATYRARGGPPSTMSGHPGHVAETTTPGSFKLGAPHVHVSKSWDKSQIPWGAEIREQDDGFQYRWPPSTGAWQWATERDGPTLETPLKKSLLKYLPRVVRNGQSVMIWTINDFGPTAWQLVPSANYVHTTPAAEADAARGVPADLVHSHGCIHLDPRERDEMVNRGFLRTGVPFVVHEWSEHVLPNMVRRDMLRGSGAAAPRNGEAPSDRS